RGDPLQGAITGIFGQVTGWPAGRVMAIIVGPSADQGDAAKVLSAIEAAAEIIISRAVPDRPSGYGADRIGLQRRTGAVENNHGAAGVGVHIGLAVHGEKTRPEVG